MREPITCSSTCFGISLNPHFNKATSVTTLIGERGNLMVVIGPSGVGGWYGFFRLTLPDDFYNTTPKQPSLQFEDIPTTHVNEKSPEEVIRKLESLGRMLLPHFEQVHPSAWDRIMPETEPGEVHPILPDDPIER